MPFCKNREALQTMEAIEPLSRFLFLPWLHPVDEDEVFNRERGLIEGPPIPLFSGALSRSPPVFPRGIRQGRNLKNRVGPEDGKG